MARELMGKARLPQHDFTDGLNTTRSAAGMDQPWFTVFQNVRTTKGPAMRRPGLRRTHRFATAGMCADFDGSNDYVEIPAVVAQIVLPTTFTVEWLCSNDTLAAAMYVLGADATPGVTIRLDPGGAAGQVIVDVIDSAGVTVTLTAAKPIGLTGLCWGQLKRNGAALTLLLNGVVAATGTMSATLSTRAPTTYVRLGQSAGASWFDGKIEWVRGFSYVRASNREGASRLLNPRAPGVRFDWVTDLDSNGYCLDRSRFGNHGKGQGGLAASASSLAVNHAPVQAIAPYQDGKLTRKLHVIAGGRQFTGTI